ncbi:4-hydroxybenzoate octaprenyltransferase [Afifella sp. IM 167]|uniref:4-hydroxybenzoate octaprenyltransferase n=1 Tax=Afifella sp. IM 167 TaxID=2033586 RepID=UPI001CCFD2D2|nr:4-hydroxybenzoate octaprenyltransferase [Afifella sp. IM 167]MBZ8133469.1 4-hydroxybenzoate octaprenyltransferase [Afifella sp. IM 167]
MLEKAAPGATTAGALPDSVARHWLDRYAPDWLKPYGRLARWDRPIGWWLLLWPCWWSAALASVQAEGAFPNIWHMILFLIGAVAMRGAGCTYNDLVDQDIDAKVARTRARPIPSGAVSWQQALLFLFLQCLVGLLVLVQFNAFTIMLGFASLVFVAIYPFMKRVTHWPQIVLGISFSWGALVGWSAVFGSLAVAPVLLYLGAISWTMAYDTIYAHQDKEDDALIGIGSTAQVFGEFTRPALAGFFALTILLMAIAFVLVDASVIAFIGLLAAAGHFAWQVLTLDIDDADNCLTRFRSNRDAGTIIFAGLCLDALVRAIFG